MILNGGRGRFKFFRRKGVAAKAWSHGHTFDISIIVVINAFCDTKALCLRANPELFKGEDAFSLKDLSYGCVAG